MLMAKILRLHILPSDGKVLRAQNLDVSFPLTPEVKKLIADMKTTVKKAPGIGLAAPQVGVNIKLAVIYLEEFGLKGFTIINPVVVSRSIKKSIMQEGCLSIPGVFGPVKRPAKPRRVQKSSSKAMVFWARSFSMRSTTSTVF